MKLLMNGPTLIVHPSLAAKIGLHEAIFLQQLHYKLQFSRTLMKDYIWHQCTIDNWLLQMPFLSRRTLERTIQSLCTMQLIERLRLDSNGTYYRIRYESLQELLIVDNTPNRQKRRIDSNHAPICGAAVSQNGGSDMSYWRVETAENADISMADDALRIKEKRIKETKNVLLYAQTMGGQWGVDEGQVFQSVYEVVKNGTDIGKLLKQIRRACQQQRTLYPQDLFGDVCS